ncbi:MAG: hypothetical protein M3O70_12915 [Actinomycetota bacterium]|nr:hypothetical protein [Actinomycetota bacterium]
MSVPSPSTTVDRSAPRDGSRHRRLPTLRIGAISGLVAILCCVGPTTLALLGVISGATAYAVATELYADWAWGFRLAGIAVAAGLVWWALRRRDACNLDGLRRSWRSLVLIAVVGSVTYVALYAFTTWLGTFAA